MATAIHPQPTATPSVPEATGLYEFLNGNWELKPVSTRSIAVGFSIAHRLKLYAVERQSGRALTECLFPIPWRDDPERLRRPDAAFVSSERWPLDRELPDSDPWPVVPEIAAEVVSLSNRWTDVDDKVGEYFAAGVQLLWVVYPGAGRVYAYTAPEQVRILTRGDTLDAAPVLPDFRLPLAELFGPNP